MKQSFCRSWSSPAKIWKFLLNSQRNYWTLVKKHTNLGHEMGGILRFYLLFLVTLKQGWLTGIILHPGLESFWDITMISFILEWQEGKNRHIVIGILEAERGAGLSSLSSWSLISSAKDVKHRHWTLNFQILHTIYSFICLWWLQLKQLWRVLAHSIKPSLLCPLWRFTAKLRIGGEKQDHGA